MNGIIFLCGLFSSMYIGALIFSFVVKWAEMGFMPIEGFWADVIKPSFQIFGIVLFVIIACTATISPILIAFEWIRANQ
jgi:hypothetical protein